MRQPHYYCVSHGVICVRGFVTARPEPFRQTTELVDLEVCDGSIPIGHTCNNSPGVREAFCLPQRILETCNLPFRVVNDRPAVSEWIGSSDQTILAIVRASPQ